MTEVWEQLQGKHTHIQFTDSRKLVLLCYNYHVAVTSLQTDPEFVLPLAHTSHHIQLVLPSLQHHWLKMKNIRFKQDGKTGGLRLFNDILLHTLRIPQSKSAQKDHR